MLTDQEIGQKQLLFNRLMAKLQRERLTNQEEKLRIEIIDWQVQNKVWAIMTSDGKTTKFVKMIKRENSNG